MNGVTFVLLAGAWQGGWVYEAVVERLALRGQVAVPMTLSGLGDTPAPGANLDTHIAEVVDVVKMLDGDVVIVGQSYAGMVVSGVAEAALDRVRALVYVDAYVPESGDSVWSLTTPRFRALFIEGAKGDGLACRPPPGMSPRCRPHPMGSLLQSITLTGRWRDAPRKIFIGALGWDGSPFLELRRRLASEPDWTTFGLDCGHNVARSAPDTLAAILLDLA
jgi:pimeloyl-ACP methyl ester carboxylesterase